MMADLQFVVSPFVGGIHIRDGCRTMCGLEIPPGWSDISASTANYLGVCCFCCFEHDERIKEKEGA